MTACCTALLYQASTSTDTGRIPRQTYIRRRRCSHIEGTDKKPWDKVFFTIFLQTNHSEKRKNTSEVETFNNWHITTLTVKQHYMQRLVRTWQLFQNFWLHTYYLQLVKNNNRFAFVRTKKNLQPKQNILTYFLNVCYYTFLNWTRSLVNTQQFEESLRKWQHTASLMALMDWTSSGGSVSGRSGTVSPSARAWQITESIADSMLHVDATLRLTPSPAPLNCALLADGRSSVSKPAAGLTMSFCSWPLPAAGFCCSLSGSTMLEPCTRSASNNDLPTFGGLLQPRNDWR